MTPSYFETFFRLNGPVPEWPERFVIMSAYETTGEDWSEAKNRLADESLRRELQGRCSWHMRVIGTSADGKHDEPCWAFELALNQAYELGLRYKQDALYAVEGDMLFVSFCDDRRGLETVGKFRERLRLA